MSLKNIENINFAEHVNYLGILVDTGKKREKEKKKWGILIYKLKTILSNVLQMKGSS